MKRLLIATAVCGLFLVGAAGSADAFGLLRCECRSPCPPPPPAKIVLQVSHPCFGCKYDIPVCLPACCLGNPCVTFERTLIGYGRTVFEWQCGYVVVVRYPPGGGYRVIERG